MFIKTTKKGKIFNGIERNKHMYLLSHWRTNVLLNEEKSKISNGKKERKKETYILIDAMIIMIICNASNMSSQLLNSKSFLF